MRRKAKCESIVRATLPQSSSEGNGGRKGYFRLMRLMTSARVEGLVLKSPRTALVTVRLPGLRIPRMVMQV